jgi:hypothetical protein
MRTTIVVAAALALIATSAMGQSSSRDRRDWEDRDGYDQSDWRDAPRYDRGGRRGDDDRRDDERGPTTRMEAARPGTGARFFLRSGDTRLGVVCDARESTRSCVDAALTLFDRLRSQQGATPSAPPQPSAPGATPTPR